ncbi:MAG: Flp pilus assembly complex ATPase component TadA [Candidatus Odinarchaeota archaeon]|nr:Flp pilus assembly complex ATPase component TadA [Candidatus Odinarchaeota archaeon]
MTEIIVPDTSIIIERWLSRKIKKGKLNDVKIVIPNAVVAEIEYQANTGKAIGFAGLEELKALRELAEQKKIELEFFGDRPSPGQIKYASKGEIDALIRKQARELGAKLITSDYIQASLARAEGIETEYIKIKKKRIKIEDFFSENTMSVHLKEGVPPLAKRGSPGHWELVKIREEPMTLEELQSIAMDIIERTRSEKDSFIEIDEPGATVIQMRDYRIAIARPPFSDGMEITAVRPLVKMTINDYNVSDKLLKRLRERAEGILIAGPPGAGKSTFASALAEFYSSMNKIVKTIEKPRDLQVGPDITQYTALRGSLERTADVLLLVRPDYCIFDELRKTRDFKIFADLRFAGVGMIGVVHATQAIDAIQRFIGRVDLGLISRVVDTVIFIKGGEIEKVYSLNLTVKVPTGMTERDLARPVIEVRDFERGELEYEIYVFGEQVVVAPVKEVKGEKRRKREVTKREKTPVEIETTRKHYILFVPPALARKLVNFYADEDLLFTVRAGKRGEVKIRKTSNYGKILEEALKLGRRIYAE